MNFWARVTVTSLLTVVACTDRQERRSVVQVELHGRRALLASTDGERPCFDVKALPRIRVKGGIETDELLVEAINASGRTALPVETILGMEAVWLQTLSSSAASGWRQIVVSFGGRVVERFPICWRPAPGQLAEVAELRRAVEQNGALHIAHKHLDEGALDPWNQLWVWFELGSIHRRADRLDEAEVAFNRATRLAEASGYWTLAVEAACAGSYVAIVRRDWSTARTRLGKARALARRAEPSVESRLLFYEALIALETGRLRSARQAFLGAKEYALEAGDRVMLRSVLQSVARLEDMMGRTADALLSTRKEEKLYGTPSDRKSENFGLLLSNRGWYRLRAMRRGLLREGFGRVRADFERAHEIFGALDARTRLPDLEANLAWLALTTGHLPLAQQYLDRVPQQGTTGVASAHHFRPWLEAELALADNKLGHALDVAQRLIDEIPPDSVGLDAHYRGLALGVRAAVATKQGKLNDAIADLRLAIAGRDRTTRRMPLHAGRVPAYADQRGRYVELVELLCRTGRLEEAVRVVDELQSKTLRDLDVALGLERLDSAQRTRWLARVRDYEVASTKLSVARDRCSASLGTPECARELSYLGNATVESFDKAMALVEASATAWPESLKHHATLNQGEAVVWFVAIDAAWLVFVQRGQERPRVLRILGHGIEQLAQPLRGVKHVYLVPDATVGSPRIDAQGLKVESTSIIPYAGWLSAFPSRSAAPPLVVAAPGSDLMATRGEGEAVARAVPNARLLVGSHATRDRVLARLKEGPELFHFAGHGHFDADDPWQARLELSGGESLSLEDVLLYPTRVGLAVLNGCSTGPTAPGRVALPYAFLLNGADAVVATTAPVADTEARAFITAFYRAGGAERPADALRAAARDRAERGSGVGKHFKLFGRPVIRVK